MDSGRLVNLECELKSQPLALSRRTKLVLLQPSYEVAGHALGESGEVFQVEERDDCLLEAMQRPACFGGRIVRVVNLSVGGLARR